MANHSSWGIEEVLYSGPRLIRMVILIVRSGSISGKLNRIPASEEYFLVQTYGNFYKEYRLTIGNLVLKVLVRNIFVTEYPNTQLAEH